MNKDILIKNFNNLNKKFLKIKEFFKNYNFLKKQNNEEIKTNFDFFVIELLNFKEYLNIAISENDLDLLKNLSEKIIELKTIFNNIEKKLFFQDFYDSMNAFFDIHAGSGGTDSQDIVTLMVKMYTSWFEKRGFKYNIYDIVNGDISGFKSVSIKIIGDNAFGWLKHESGIHRIVRKSPFNSNNKRHTSFISVHVYPDIEKNIEITIKESDLEIHTFRSKGAGGQHVNTTDSAVRIKHIPTGIVVKCQAERSQHQNKTNALRQLKAKLYALNSIKNNKKKIEFEKNKLSITWGNQIRSYILDKSIIKDLRTNVEIKDINFILNGNLDDFIFAVFYKKLDEL